MIIVDKEKKNTWQLLSITKDPKNIWTSILCKQGRNIYA